METDEHAGEALGDALERVEASGAVDAELGLGGLDTLGLPEIAGEFGDEFVFGEADGVPLGAEAVVELGEGFGRLAGEEVEGFRV